MARFAHYFPSIPWEERGGVLVPRVRDLPYELWLDCRNRIDAWEQARGVTGG